MEFRVRVVAIGVILLCSLGVLSAGDPSAGESSQILDSYLAVSRSQRDRLNGSIAEVSIDAELPRLHKRGRLSALRHISRVGRITYDILRYDGDNAVKNDVIARYLSAEVQARESRDASMVVALENYKFSYKGRHQFDGRSVYVFDVKPRAKRKGLFKGTLWIDAQNYLPVRESGYLVKSPSVFIKRVHFTRDYETANGLAVVARIDTTVETRIAGEAHMTVRYADYRFDPASVDVGLISADSQ
jgi:hypothetical protein